ncbi:MAG: hypothetical protein AB7F50_07520 [Fimbriimonadaceae bacterium]
MNGFDYGPDPRERRDAAVKARRSSEEEARATRKKLQEEIAALVEKRLELRMSASETAGGIGLQYDSETNNFVRSAREDASGYQPREPVARPEPLAPLEVESQPVDNPPTTPRPISNGPDIVLWAFVVVIGALVGLGLMTLVGFSWRRDSWVIPVGAVLGVCVLGGLKILVSTLWIHVGRQSALGSSEYWRLVPAVLFTAGGCTLDAHLGALAMHEYIRARELTTATVPPYGQLFFLALAVTCPLLLASGARAYRRGISEPTLEERQESHRMERAMKHETAIEANIQRKAEHHAALQQLSLESYGDRVAANDELERRAHAANLEREAEWDALKGNADFKCLQGLISQIGVLNQEIEERRRNLTNVEIRDGHERTRDRRQDDARNKKSPPWVVNHRTDETEEAHRQEEGVATLE